jgi:hypothetical protein
MRTKTGKIRNQNWSTRRVAIVASDHHHTIHLIAIKMPVRVKDIGVDQVIYEGPVAAVWERVQIEQPIVTENLDMVGILFADTSAMFAGLINWVTQSRQATVEDGADRMLKKKLEEEADL